MNDTTATAVASPAPSASSGPAPQVPSESAFARAFASDASPASHPPDASTTPPAAAQPGSDQGLPQQPESDRSPFIPRDRFDEVNTRMQAAEAWKARYGWAESMSPQEFQTAQAIAKHFVGGDMLAGLRSLVAEIRQNPAQAALLNQEQARLLAQYQQAQQPTSTEPQMVQVQLEDGSVFTTPRDPQAWLAHQKDQWLAELRQELSPVTQTVTDLQQARDQAVLQQQIDHFVTTTYQDVTTWPGMESADTRTAVANELAMMRVDPNDPREVSLALNAAYRKVVLPTLGRQAEARLLDSLKTKAQASSAVNPGSAAPTSPQTVTRFDQLGPERWR